MKEFIAKVAELCIEYPIFIVLFGLIIMWVVAFLSDALEDWLYGDDKD